MQGLPELSEYWKVSAHAVKLIPPSLIGCGVLHSVIISRGKTAEILAILG